jgi:hypothetical protein
VLRSPSAPRRRPAVLFAIVAGLLGAHVGTAPAPAAVVGPDVIATIATEGTVVRGGLATFRLTVRNLGTEATDGPVRLRIDNDYPQNPSTSYDGVGWSCDTEPGLESYCTLDRALAAGETAPLLTVRRRSTTDYFGWDSGDRFVELEAGPFGAPTRAEVPVVASSLVDVGLTGSSLPAEQYGPREYALRVRNGDGAPTDAPLVAELRTGTNDLVSASGDGWSCDTTEGRCVYAATLRPLERAPVLHVVSTRSEETLWYEPDSLVTELTGGGDDDTDPSEQLRLDTTRRRTQVDLLPVATDSGVERDGARHVQVRVHAAGPADSAGPVRVELSRDYGSTPDPAVRASGVGWSCFPGAGACTYAETIPTGSSTPPLDVAVPIVDAAGEVRLGAEVSGGGDVVDDYPYAWDNNHASVVVSPGGRAAGDGLRLSIPRAAPLTRGSTAIAEIVAQNPATAPARSQSVVHLSTGLPANAAGDGWVCTSQLTCRYERLLPPGEEAPPIRVRTTVPLTAAVEGTILSARAPGADVSISSGTADGVAAPAVRIDPPGALVPGERASVVARVANDGSTPLPGPVSVRLSDSRSDARRAGVDWNCVEDDDEYGAELCTHDGPVPAAASLPPITTTFDTPASGATYIGGRATVYSGPVRDVQPTSADWSSPVLGRPVDLTVTAEDPRPQIGDEPGAATLVVRNRGVRSSAAGVRVSVPSGDGARAVGEGWVCGRTCRHDGAVAAGGSLPPIRVTLPIAQENRITVGLTSRVTGADDVDHANDETSLVVPALTRERGRFLSVDVGSTSTAPPRRSETVGFAGSVSAVGGVDGGVSLDVDSPPGLIVEAVEAEGLTCRTPTSCRWRTAPKPEEYRSFTVTARLADDAVGPLSLGVTATGDAADISPGTDTARVVPEDSGADLTVSVGDSPPVVLGGPFRVPVVVRNGGSADTPGPVDVRFSHPTASMGDVTTTGPGWECERDGLSCRWPGGLEAGAALPELVIRPNLHPEDYRFTSGPIVASVSDEADTQRRNDGARGRVPTSGVPVADLVAAVSPAERIVNGDGTPFDIRIRNTGGRTTTEPVQVDVAGGQEFRYDDDGVASVASGDGWRCSGRRGRCTLDRALEPGAEAPVLRTIARVPSFPVAGYPLEDLAAASVRVVRGDAGAASGNNYATSEAPARPAADADVVATIDETGPVENGGPAVFTVRAVNAGRSATTEPVEVQVTDGFQDRASLDGDGWVCGGDVCRLPDALAAGVEAPPLRLEVHDAFGVRVGAVSGGIRVTGDAGGWTSNNGAYATAGVHVADGGQQDLLATIDDHRPSRVGAAASANVRVRNLGTIERPGPVVVRAGSGDEYDMRGVVGGEGWSCTGSRCVHAGPVPAGGALPPIAISAPAATWNTLGGTSFRAWVVPDPADTSRPEDARAAVASVPAAVVPADLGVSMRGGGPLRPGETTTVTARVHNAGGEPYDRPVVAYVSATAGRLTVEATGDGWTCVNRRCERPGPLGVGEETPPIVVTARAPRRDGAGSASVEVSLRPPGDDWPLPQVAGDWLAFDDVAYVGIGVGAGHTDLVPWVTPEVVPVAGGTASTLVHVANVGSESSGSTTGVTLTSSLPDARASGDGWTCDGLRCTRPGVTGATTAPPIRVLAAVPAGSPRGELTLGVRVDDEDDDVTGNDATTWSAGIAGAAADEVRGSPYFDVASQHGSIRPAERATFQVRLRGIAPADGAPATITTRLPAGLTYAGVPGDEPEPEVDDRTLTWRVTLPDEAANRTLTFRATVAADAAPGSELRLDSTLTSPALAATQRRTDRATVGAPAVTGVTLSTFHRGAPVTLGVLGAVLRSTDDFELVSGDAVITGTEASGDGGRVDVTFDPRGRPVGTYDLVVRRGTGGTLRLAGAISIVEAPPSPEPPTPTTPPTPAPGDPGPSGPSAGPGPGPAPATGPTGASAPSASGADAAAALAALIAGLGGSPPAGTPRPVAPPTTDLPLAMRFVEPRAPRLGALVRSGWLVTVRTTAPAALRIELRADAATSRRLGLRRGSIVAAGRSGVRPAGDIRLRLRVPRSARVATRRVSRLSGTLTVRSTSTTTPVSIRRRIVLRR